MLLAYSWLSMALGLAQMVLDVRKNLKSTQFYILNNLWLNNFSKKTIPGDVRAQVLQEPVGASHADQGRKSGVPHLFSDPGGQARSNGTPHLGIGPRGAEPQGGGRCWNIYKDTPLFFCEISSKECLEFTINAVILIYIGTTPPPWGIVGDGPNPKCGVPSDPA